MYRDIPDPKNPKPSTGPLKNLGGAHKIDTLRDSERRDDPRRVADEPEMITSWLKAAMPEFKDL